MSGAADKPETNKMNDLKQINYVWSGLLCINDLQETFPPNIFKYALFLPHYGYFTVKLVVSVYVRYYWSILPKISMLRKCIEDSQNKSEIL